MVLTVLKTQTPDYAIFAFDAREKTFRHELFTEYKATRVKAPQSLYDQIPLIREGLEALQATCVIAPGFEADDILGAISSEHGGENLQIYIATGDLDALQLVNNNVRVITPAKGIINLNIYDEQKVFDRFQVSPKQIPDYKALCGDKSDNIPGLMGIGPKQATKLLTEFKNIEGIYKNLDKLTAKIKNLFQDNEKQVLLSKNLATIKTELNLKLEIENSAVDKFNTEALKTFFSKYECFNLIKKMDFLQKKTPVNETFQPSLF